MIFFIMLVGICAAFSISKDYPTSMNVVLLVLCIFCFSASIYVGYFLEKNN